MGGGGTDQGFTKEMLHCTANKSKHTAVVICRTRVVFNVENAVENIYVNPAFFFFLASDHNQTSGVVRKACKNRFVGYILVVSKTFHRHVSSWFH